MMRIPYIVGMVCLIIINLLLFASFVNLMGMRDKKYGQDDGLQKLNRVKRLSNVNESIEMDKSLSKITEGNNSADVDVFLVNGTEGKHFDEIRLHVNTTMTYTNTSTTSVTNEDLGEYEDSTINSTRSTPVTTELGTPTLNLQKCCKKGEVLNFLYNCEAKEGSEIRRWYPDKFVENYTMVYTKVDPSRIQMTYGAPKCPSGELTQVAWRKKNFDNAYFISDYDGSLLQMDGTNILATYKSSSFCVDVVHETPNIRYHMALLCPCSKSVCIKKCCPYGQAYDAASRSCNRSTIANGLIKLFKPNFYLNESFEMKPAHYFISPGHEVLPTCTVVLNTEIKGTMQNEAKSQVNKDGEVILFKGNVANVLTQNMSYCMDEFYTNNSYKIKAMFCKDDNLVYHRTNISNIEEEILGLEEAVANQSNENMFHNFNAFILTYLLLSIICIY